MEQKGIPRKTILDFYAFRLVRTITCYLKFLEEFHPNHELEPQIKNLYKNCYRRQKHQSGNALEKRLSRRIDGVWDKVGL